MNYRIKVGIAFLIGILLLGGSFVFFPHNGQDGCWNNVQEIEESEISYRHESVFQYSQLSTDAKHAFEKARSSDDNTANVYGSRCPDEFSYSDGWVYYAIDKNGTYYELETVADSGGLFPIDKTLNGLLIVSGIGSLLLGIIVLYRERDIKLRRP